MAPAGERTQRRVSVNAGFRLRDKSSQMVGINPIVTLCSIHGLRHLRVRPADTAIARWLWLDSSDELNMSAGRVPKRAGFHHNLNPSRVVAIAKRFARQ